MCWPKPLEAEKKAKYQRIFLYITIFLAINLIFVYYIYIYQQQQKHQRNQLLAGYGFFFRKFVWNIYIWVQFGSIMFVQVDFIVWVELNKIKINFRSSNTTKYDGKVSIIILIIDFAFSSSYRLPPSYIDITHTWPYSLLHSPEIVVYIYKYMPPQRFWSWIFLQNKNKKSGW